MLKVPHYKIVCDAKRRRSDIRTQCQDICAISVIFVVNVHIECFYLIALLLLGQGKVHRLHIKCAECQRRGRYY